MTNIKQETIEKAAERILSKEGIKRHPSGLETYLKGNVINAMVEMVEWQKQTLEERVKELAPGHSLENTLIAFANVGAEWQAEKMYSEEDMKQFAFECAAVLLSGSDDKVKVKLVDGIAHEVNIRFKQFKN